ncbi:hypothetical protein BD779DRAFT_1479605 [Infundibulicybe gibba]|nr:hypothetical protein BD779DRAFT_1479605 [Infundibulicybe gibba]
MPGVWVITKPNISKIMSTGPRGVPVVDEHKLGAEQEGDVGQHGWVHAAPLVLFPEVAGADEIQDSLSACSATRLIDKGEGKDVPYLMPETKLIRGKTREYGNSRIRITRSHNRPGPHIHMQCTLATGQHLHSWPFGLACDGFQDWLHQALFRNLTSPSLANERLRVARIESFDGMVTVARDHRPLSDNDAMFHSLFRRPTSSSLPAIPVPPHLLSQPSPSLSRRFIDTTTTVSSRKREQMGGELEAKRADAGCGFRMGSTHERMRRGTGACIDHRTGVCPPNRLEENTSKELVWRLEFITTVSLTDRCGLWSKVRCHGYGRMDFFRELWNTWGIDDGEKSEGLELIGCMSFWSH